MYKAGDIKPKDMVTMCKGMPTAEELAEGKYDWIIDEEGTIWKIIDNINTFKKINDNLEYDTSVKTHKIMAVYKQNGYELELVWSRPEEKSKEERVIEILEQCKRCLSVKKLEEAINILRGE